MTKVTDKITVNVQPEYHLTESNPLEDEYIWSYTVQIQNNRKEKVKLLNRHWLIIDETGNIKEVRDAGVIGLQPTIKKNEIFEYSSFVKLHKSSGIMMGSYEFLSEEGLITAAIPTFSLDCPLVAPKQN